MRFSMKNREPPRFEGDFVIEPILGCSPSSQEESYIEAVNDLTDRLADEETEDQARTNPAAAALLEARKALRHDAVDALRSAAIAFCAGQDIRTATESTFEIWGRYSAERDRLSGSLFVVREQLDKQNALAIELLITVAPNLPPPNDKPSAEKQALFVALSRARTVVKTVHMRMQDRATSRFRRRFGGAANEATRADRLLDEYVRKLAGIGRLGLEGPHIELANLALDGLRSEFVAAEAGRIKNTYVRTLGLWAGIAAVAFFLFYGLVDVGFITSGFWSGHKAFLLAAAGAAIGTWLSFSIRRVTLSFDDLAILEEDLLDPGVRVIFVIALTIAVCLLFWTGATNIEIGNLKTSHFVGATSFLVGVFAGISERALATAISGRAAAFVKTAAGA
jgi:hypothetical protein